MLGVVIALTLLGSLVFSATSSNTTICFSRCLHPAAGTASGQGRHASSRTGARRLAGPLLHHAASGVFRRARSGHSRLAAHPLDRVLEGVPLMPPLMRHFSWWLPVCCSGAGRSTDHAHDRRRSHSTRARRQASDRHRIAQLCLPLLLVVCFCLATDLGVWFQSWQRQPGRLRQPAGSGDWATPAACSPTISSSKRMPISTAAFIPPFMTTANRTRRHTSPKIRAR